MTGSASYELEHEKLVRKINAQTNPDVPRETATQIECSETVPLTG